MYISKLAKMIFLIKLRGINIVSLVQVHSFLDKSQS